MLRVCSRKDRRLLGKLSQCAAETLKTLFHAANTDPAAIPGIIIAIQTYLVARYLEVDILKVVLACAANGYFIHDSQFLVCHCTKLLSLPISMMPFYSGRHTDYEGSEAVRG
jgi:hypothetical protein